MGSICKQGDMWWITYYRSGKAYRGSSGSEKKMVVKRLLDRREGDRAKGKVPDVHFDKGALNGTITHELAANG